MKRQYPSGSQAADGGYCRFGIYDVGEKSQLVNLLTMW